MTANDKIRAGLDARTNSPSAASFTISNLIGAPSSVADLNILANSVSSKNARLKVLSDSIKSAIDKHRKQKTAEYSQFGKVRDGNLVRDELGVTRRRTMIDREMTRYSREARKVSADERAKLLAEVRDIVSKVSPVRASFTDPVAVLSRRTIGDPKRATYSANLANAGPVAVENAIQDAVITGEAALLSAALDRLDGMSADQRKLVRYSKKEVAESVVADELLKARQFLAKIDLEVVEAEVADSEAEGKRTTPELKMTLGLKRAALREALGSDPEEDEEDGTERKTDAPEDFDRHLDAKYPAVPVPDNVTIIGGGG